MRDPDQFSECLRAALHYSNPKVSYGWKLFPADVARKKSYLAKKHAPEGLNWGMTSDRDLLIKNFSNPLWRDKCGVGLPTGEINGIFVIEADTKKGHKVDGIGSLRALEANLGQLPKTVTAQSPSGSLHYYFKWPGYKVWSSASKLAPGVDVRGDGGMVIAPPSWRGDGQYQWLTPDELIADAPGWLLKLVAQSAGVADDDDDKDLLEELIHIQYQSPSLDIDELLGEMQFPGNVHDTEVRASASLLSNRLTRWSTG
jgi:hypothetical protein